MLPFTNNREHRHSLHRPKDGAIKKASRRRPSQTPTRAKTSPRRSSSNFSLATHIPVLQDRDIHTSAIKKACKQDLSSLAFFAGLKAAVPDAKASPDAAASRAHHTPLSQNSECTAAQQDTPATNVTPATLDDAAWLACKTDIHRLEATLQRAFDTSENPYSDFGADLRAAEEAFTEGKAAINKASKRWTYFWEREHQFAKFSSLWDAQVALGQRLRKAQADAMERKDRILDGLMEEQVDLGTMEMHDLLGSVSPEWFEDQDGDLEMWQSL